MISFTSLVTVPILSIFSFDFFTFLTPSSAKLWLAKINTKIKVERIVRIVSSKKRIVNSLFG